MEDPEKCFICDDTLKEGTFSLFGDNTQMKSGKLLKDIASEIVNKLLQEDGHSKVVCKECHKRCVDYDTCQTRMAIIKLHLTHHLKKTLPKYNLNYDTYPFPVTVANNKNPIKISASNIFPPDKLPGNINRPIVLPASKLGNVKGPPFVVLKKLPQQNSNQIVTTQSTNPSQSISTVTKIAPSTSLVEEIASLTESKEQHYLDSKSIIGFKSLPTNIFDNSKKSGSDKDILAKSMEVINSENDETMDINNDCAFSLGNGSLLKTEMKSEQKVKFEETTQEYMTATDPLEQNDINPDGTDEKNIIIGDLEILEDGNDDADDDGNHTILMQDENGSIIRVVSGQKFIYGDKEISLIIPQGDNEGDNENQDSNDESQIELQMSGDEETANAIIAATKEEGAYIAVQSGEFFKVESVQSAVKNEDHYTKTFVEKSDDAYLCVLCANKNDEADDESVLEAPFSSTCADEIMQHMRRVHGARIYVCAVCGMVFRKKNDYSKHIASHGPKLPSTSSVLRKFECETCHKMFASRNILQDHLNTHNGERPHICSICGKSFASKYTFQAHQKIHLDRPRPFKCTTCDKSFYTQQNLNQHEKTHTGVRDFKCAECGKCFLTQHNLEVHSLVHSGVKPYVCGLCSKAFARKPEIRDHMRTHTGERPFVCNICGAAFAQRSNLQSHTRARHSDDKRHACDQCGKRFKRRRLLQYHISARHTGQRPYRCEQCGSSFVYPEHYRKHLRIHTNAKPYDCEVCGRTFNSRDSRNAHRFVHSDKKPYECLVCGAGFMRRPRLYQHMNQTGHLTESIVVNQPKINKDGDRETIELVTETSLHEQESNLVAVTEGDNGNAVFDVTEDGDSAVLLPVQLSEELVEMSEGIQVSSNEHEVLANDESGALVRLVPVRLPNGGDGWIAVN